MILAAHQPSRQRFQSELKAMGVKWCSHCDQIKDLSDFTFVKTRNHHNVRCKKCKSQWMKEDRVKNPLKYKEFDMKWLYGIGFGEYNKLMKSQNSVCAICGEKEKHRGDYLHIDHDHNTGKVRGLLCSNCNTGIGKFYENPELLRSAIEYLSSKEVYLR